MPDLDVDIEGLRQFEAGLDDVTSDLRRSLDRLSGRWADLTVKGARRRIPSRSGAAQRSIRATGDTVVAGDRRTPYYPWLDFGGRVGRRGATRRRFIRGGRAVFPAMTASREQIFDGMDDAARDAVKAQGWGVR